MKETLVKDIIIEVTRDHIKDVILANRSITKADYLEFLKNIGIDVSRNILCLYIPNNTNTYHKIREFVLGDETWSWLEKNAYHTKVVQDIIAPTVYDKFTEVTIRKDKLSIRKEVEKGIGPLYIDINTLGEGVKRTTLIYLITEYLNPRLILWDDIETAMHPSLLRTTLKRLTEQDRQVIVTTHSIDVLTELAYLEPKNTQAILLTKTPNDIVNYKTLTIDQLDEILEKGLDPRKLADILKL